jgi:hypothetical protein
MDGILLGLFSLEGEDFTFTIGTGIIFLEDIKKQLSVLNILRRQDRKLLKNY